MGAAKPSAGPATTARPATPTNAKAKTPPRPGDWMATRLAPSRAAAVGRGFFGGALLVGGLGFLVLADLGLPDDPSGWSGYFDTYIVPLLVLAVITIFTASLAGVLIEQFVPPLRAPAEDISRWPVALVLGMTVGPLSFLVAYNLYKAFGGELLEVQAGQVFGVSVLAFLLAEMFMGRGKPASSSGRGS
jgi:hypothetical protein